MPAKGLFVNALDKLPGGRTINPSNTIRRLLGSMIGKTLAVTLSAFLLLPLIISTVPVQGTTDHVMISEIYVNEINAGSEWIELYNPTDTSINIGGWVIDTKTDTSADVTLPSNAEIPAHGFYFIGDESSGEWKPDNPAWSMPDHTETMTLTDEDGWVRLRKAEGGQIVDIVGWGTATTYETAPADKPLQGKSIERKAQGTSTKETMGPGGKDADRGNGYDSDDNSQDFVLRDSPEPQNSSSPPEIPFGPPATVAVTANPTSITADGSSTSTITATVVDQYSNDVADGTVVTFTTSLGNIGSQEVTKTTTSSVATATLTSSTMAGTATITATSDSRFDTTTVEFTPGNLDRFAFDPIGDQTAGQPFNITITVQDPHNNTVTAYTGINTLSDSTGTISPTYYEQLRQRRLDGERGHHQSGHRGDYQHHWRWQGRHQQQLRCEPRLSLHRDPDRLSHRYSRRRRFNLDPCRYSEGPVQ